MEELRWLLLILGLLVIVLVYGYGRIQEWRDEGPPWRRRSESEPEPFADEKLSSQDLESTLSELDTLISEHQQEIHEPVGAESQDPPLTVADERGVPPAVTAGEAAPAASARKDSRRSERREGRFASLLGGRTREPEAERDTQHKSKSTAEEKIVVINLAAAEGRRFPGSHLVQALESAGMRYGQHQIFHRTLETSSGSAALFSAANILEPGMFDMERIADFDTPGVAFFMCLPGPYDGLVTFEQMLATAREVAERLGGHLLDGRRCDLTHQSIEHIREDLIEYRRRAHLAARQVR